MKNLLSKLQLMLMALVMMACQSDEANAMPPADNNSPNGDNKTLIVYYSKIRNSINRAKFDVVDNEKWVTV